MHSYLRWIRSSCTCAFAIACLLAVSTSAQTFVNGSNGYAGTDDVVISNVYGGNGVTYRQERAPVGTIGERQYVGLLKFTGLALPPGSKVATATLRLGFISWSSSASLAGQYLASGWDRDASALGWLNRSSTETWNTAGAGASDRLAGLGFRVAGFSAEGDQTVTVALDPAVVQRWIDVPASNQGIVLTADAANAPVHLYSSAASNLALRPALTITTAGTTSGTPPPVVSPPGPSAPTSGPVYEVGPDKPYTSIGSVPWESLPAGATVLIHWRSTPYAEKWVIGRDGTASAPITVRGVPNSAGQLPVISGANAVAAPRLSYWLQERSLLKIGGSNIPADNTPSYIVIENLELRSAHSSYTFTARNGAVTRYLNNAAAIFIEKGDNITIRNCRIHDSGNGIFVASSDAVASRNILIEGNYVYGNGNVNSTQAHNAYTAAIGITYHGNRFGPLRAGALGNNVKDRSAGLVVRYNWIEGGNRQLDLVDAEDSYLIRGSAEYRQTFVYGNVLFESDGEPGRQIVHYGGDSGATGAYRKGTLYFYNNTVVSERTTRTVLFLLSTGDERADVRNNIVYVSKAPGGNLALFEGAGSLRLTRNWLNTGAVATFGTLTGSVSDDGTTISGSAPGFVNAAAEDFRLTASSAAVDAGNLLNSAVLPARDVSLQYVKHQRTAARPDLGLLDIGAFEYSLP